MYSQNDEERFVLEFFGSKTGNFLDVGAYNGIDLSNTRRLVELGWTGVLVEPWADSFSKLFYNSISYADNLVLVHAAVSNTVGLKRLWVDATPDRCWSTTLSEDLVKAGSVMAPHALDVFVPTTKLEDLAIFGPFDFVSLDAEWEDWGILVSTPSAFWKDVSLVCIEPRNGEERRKMRAWFERLDWSLAYETPENLLMKQF